MPPATSVSADKHLAAIEAEFFSQAFPVVWNIVASSGSCKMASQESDAPPSQSRFSLRGTESSIAQPGSSITPVSRRPSPNGHLECLIPSPHKPTPSRSSSLIPRRSSAAASQRDQNAGEKLVVQSLRCTLHVLCGLLAEYEGKMHLIRSNRPAAAERVKVVVRVRPPKPTEAGGAVRVGPDHRGIVLSRE